MGSINSNHQIEPILINFAGGQASAKSEGSLGPNEFAKVNNVIILPQGAGIRTKPGNSKYNSSAIGSGNAVQGVGYMKYNDQTEQITAVCNGVISNDEGLTGTFSTLGSHSVTAGANYLWHMTSLENLMIWVGGNDEFPFSINQTQTISELTDAPKGTFGVAHNGRLFIGGSAAEPSTISWSTLTDITDFSGDGSGSADVNDQDGQKLVAAIPIGLNTLLLAKEKSSYTLTGRSSPFPVFPLFADKGCAGAKAWAVDEGLAYIVDNSPELWITDGTEILDTVKLPALFNIHDEWAEVVTSRKPYIQVEIVRGDDFKWAVISVTRRSGSTNNYAYIWDIHNKCWLTASTGLKSNGFTVGLDGTLYMAGYDGHVYECLQEDLYTEASEGDDDVSWEVRSGQRATGSYTQTNQVQKAMIRHRSESTGQYTFGWGYDTPAGSTPLSLENQFGYRYGSGLYGSAVWVSTKFTTATVFTLGRGNFFSWKLSGSNPAVIDSLSFYGLAKKAPKDFQVR